MLGLEDDELRAQIDLHERRQQSIKRMKSRSRPDSAIFSTTRVPLSSSRVYSTRSPRPPPPYQARQTDYAKANRVDSRVSNIANAATIHVAEEQLPPYTDPTLPHRTRRPPQSQIEAAHSYRAAVVATSIAGTSPPPNGLRETTRLASLTEEVEESGSSPADDSDSDRRLSSGSDDLELVDFEYVLVITNSRDE